MQRKEHFLDRESPDTSSNPTREERFAPANYAPVGDSGVLSKCLGFTALRTHFLHFRTSLKCVPILTYESCFVGKFTLTCNYFHSRFGSELGRKPAAGVSYTSPKYMRPSLSPRCLFYTARPISCLSLSPSCPKVAWSVWPKPAVRRGFDAGGAAHFSWIVQLAWMTQMEKAT